MENAGVPYLRMSCINTVRPHFPCGIVFIIYILRQSSLWRPFDFKSFQNAKIYCYTDREMTTKSKYKLISKNV